jgi:flagellar hook-length control protein FliK
MGLVLQNTIDSFMPVLDPAAAAPGQSAASGANEGIFASLLAELSAGLGGAEPSTAEDELGTEMPDDQPATPDGALGAMLAALLPTPAPVQPATQAVVEVQSNTGVSAITDAPTSEAPFASESPAPGSTYEAPPTASQPTVAVAEPATKASEHSPDAIGTVAGLAKPAAESRTERPAPPDGLPPNEAGEQPANEAASVVRSVGNAETETREESKEKSRERGDSAPARRASVQGIAHANANSPVGQLRETPPVAAESTAGPTAEAPAPAPAELPQQVEHVATTVIEQIEAGGGEARIHLDPVDLGEVTIHVRTEGDTVSIEVRAERPEAAQLLRDHTQDLSQLLGSRGLNLSDVNVGLGRGNAGEWGQDAQPQNRVPGGEFANILGGDATPLETHNRLRAAYNPDGAHMYRV